MDLEGDDGASMEIGNSGAGEKHEINSSWSFEADNVLRRIGGEEGEVLEHGSSRQEPIKRGLVIERSLDPLPARSGPVRMPLMNRLRACHTCGLIHRLPELQGGQTAACVRCGGVLYRPDRARRSAARTAAAALGAFILFWPAVLLPVLEIEKLGHRYESSILAGGVELLRGGSWLVGGVVLLFSVVFPLVKLTLLIELSFFQLFQRREKALSYRIMEHAGKWSMMDVLLLAFLVMLVKLGNLVTFRFGPAVTAFVLCVALSMAASIAFDPHAIWGDETGTGEARA